jgi:hypothetical protein
VWSNRANGTLHVLVDSASRADSVVLRVSTVSEATFKTLNFPTFFTFVAVQRTTHRMQKIPQSIRSLLLLPKAFNLFLQVLFSDSWDLHSDDYDDYRLVECDTVRFGTSVWTFRKDVLPSSSVQKNDFLWCTETLVPVSRMSRHHIPEYSNLQAAYSLSRLSWTW